MAELTISGTVMKLFPTEVVGTNNFYKRDIVIRTEDQYPQDISVQFVQDKCETLESYVPGTKVNISFNLRGKLDGFTNAQGETKYFNTVQGWKISRADGQQQPSQTNSAPAPAPDTNAQQVVYVHTNSEHTEAALKAKGWTEGQLVDKGFGHFQPVGAPTAPAAPSAPKPNL